MGTRIKLTESTDARNSRMWKKFSNEDGDFARHVALIEWQDRADAPKMVAWMEGPAGLAKRAERGVPGYEDKIRSIAS